MNRIAAVVCIVWVQSAAVAAPSGLGTLLFTPNQRTDIENGRNAERGLTLEVSVKRLSGIVRRTGAKGTVWVNDEAIREDGPDAPKLQGMGAVVKGRRLKVGESIDTITGSVSDLVPPGSVKAQISKPRP